MWIDRYDVANSYFSHLFERPAKMKVLGSGENYIRNSVLGASHVLLMALKARVGMYRYRTWGEKEGIQNSD